MADRIGVSGSPARKVVPLTRGVPFTDGPCRSLLVGAAGTANITDGDGFDRDNVPLQQGYNPLVVTALRVGGTANDFWGLY